MKKLLLIALLGCGHKEAPPPQEPAGGSVVGQQEIHDDRVGGEGQMIAPEKMDEIKRLLDRKQNIVSHCLAVAVDNKELPKNSRGKLLVGFTINADGSSSQHKILEKSLESKTLEECVIGRVKEIQFPQIKHSIEYSYAYAFEAM